MKNKIPSQQITQDQAIEDFFSIHGSTKMDMEQIETTLDGLLLNALCNQDSDGSSRSAEFFILVKDFKTLIKALNPEQIN